MDANAKNMNNPWLCSPPLVNPKMQIEDGRAYTKARKYNISDEHIDYIIFKIVTDTNHLKHA